MSAVLMKLPSPDIVIPKIIKEHTRTDKYGTLTYIPDNVILTDYIAGVRPLWIRTLKNSCDIEDPGKIWDKYFNVNISIFRERMIFAWYDNRVIGTASLLPDKKLEELEKLEDAKQKESANDSNDSNNTNYINLSAAAREAIELYPDLEPEFISKFAYKFMYVAVEKEYRGNGIGTAMLVRLLDNYLQDFIKGSIYIETANPEFFSALGFVTVDINKDTELLNIYSSDLATV